MGEEGRRESVCDAGALIRIDRGDRPALRAVMEERGGSIIVPAAVLAQVWRNGARQARLAKFIANKDTVVEDLTEHRAKAIGRILARSGTSDVVDASVVLAARLHRALVLTSDPDNLRRIDPSLDITVV